MWKISVSIVSALLACLLSGCTPKAIETPASWKSTPERDRLFSKYIQCVDSGLLLDDGVSPASDIASALDGDCADKRVALIASLHGNPEEMRRRLIVANTNKVLRYRKSKRFEEGRSR